MHMRKILTVLVTLLVAAVLSSADSLAKEESPPAPGEPYGIARKHYLQFSMKGLDAAIEHYNEALAIDSGFAPAHSGLAEAYSYRAYIKTLESENYEPDFIDGYEHMRLALGLSEDSLETQRALGMSYLHVRHFTYAKRAAERALVLDPEDAESLYILWQASGGKLKDPLLKKALKSDPKLVIAHIGRANAYVVRENNFGKGVKHYKKALKLSPDMVHVRNLLGSALLLKGKYPKALEAFQDAIEISPGSAHSHFNAGLALDKMGQTRDAIPYFAKAAELNPHNPETLYFLARAQHGINDTASAARSYQRFIRLAPDTEQYAAYLAYARTSLDYIKKR